MHWQLGHRAAPAGSHVTRKMGRKSIWERGWRLHTLAEALGPERSSGSGSNLQKESPPWQPLSLSGGLSPKVGQVGPMRKLPEAGLRSPVPKGRITERQPPRIPTAINAHEPGLGASLYLTCRDAWE